MDLIAFRHPVDHEVGEAVGELVSNIRGPARVVDGATGTTVVIVDRYPGDLAALRQALLGYPLGTTLRSAGIRNRSASFGFTARQPMLQRNSCRECLGAAAAPWAHRTIVEAASDLEDQLHELLGDPAAGQSNLARSLIRSEWFLPQAARGLWRPMWTSGVVNRDSPMPYHRDRNNVAGCWSAMPVIRRGMRAGHLSIPEYDLVLACRDGDVVYFDGGDLLHGVTPMRRVAADGYRLSAVYYTIANMAHCLEPEAELARGREARTASEDDAVARQREIGYLE